MSTSQTVTGSVTLLYGTQGSGNSTMLIVNLDAANTVWVNESAQVQYGGPVGIPVPPGASISMTSTQGLWAVCAPGVSVQIALIPNGTQYFVPTTLSNLGGIKVYVQADEPTGTIPVNSLWLQETDGVVTGFNTWDGTDWVPQQFNASEVLAVGTIVANLIAAGQVYAGIVDGTEIDAATFKGDDFIINSDGVFVYDGTPGPGAILLAYWSTNPGTDPWGNQYGVGLVLGAPGGPQVTLSPSGPAGAGTATFPTGADDEASPLTLFSQALATASGSPYLAGQLQGPANTNDASGQQFSIVTTSPSDDGTVQATMALTDVFGLAYLVLSNGGTTQVPALGIGTTVPGTNPADLITPAFIQAALNGCLASYGTTSGGTFTTKFTADGSWTVPPGVTSATFTNTGSSAGGAGGAQASTGGGEGAGAGAYSAATITVTPGDTYTATVPAGGAAGAANHLGGNGATGKWTGPTGAVVTAAAGGTAATAASVGKGGQASAGTGTVKYSGGDGGKATSTGGSGGGGAASARGNGATGSNSSSASPGGGVSGGGAGGGWGTGSPTTGGNGGSPGGGGGGGGGSTSAAAQAGGAGARSEATVTYTVPGSGAAIAMSLASAAGTDYAGNAFPAGYMGQVTAVDPVNGGPETWHDMTLINGWTLGSGGYAQYKLGADNRVYLRGHNLVPGTATNGTSIWTIPTEYLPTVDAQPVTAFGSWSPVPTFTGTEYTPTQLEAKTAGSLIVYGLNASNTTVANIAINDSYPID